MVFLHVLQYPTMQMPLRVSMTSQLPQERAAWRERSENSHIGIARERCLQIAAESPAFRGEFFEIADSLLAMWMMSNNHMLNYTPLPLGAQKSCTQAGIRFD